MQALKFSALQSSVAFNQSTAGFLIHSILFDIQGASNYIFYPDPFNLFHLRSHPIHSPSMI
jgi:hypothetical protein